MARGLLEFAKLARAVDPPRSPSNTQSSTNEPSTSSHHPITIVESTCDEQPKIDSRDESDSAVAESDLPATPGIDICLAAPPKTSEEARVALLELTANGFPYPRRRRLVSLEIMVALYTGRRVLKDAVRTSNWDKPLSQRQMECECPLSCTWIYADLDNLYRCGN
jgi:hypothetical protein